MNKNGKKSEITVLPYPGEEEIIGQKSQRFFVRISEPESLMIVLGASNKPENELYSNTVINDNIPVYKRKGGGGAVLLGPGMVIITLKGIVKSRFDNKRYFDLIQYIIKITLLKKIGLKVKFSGISDITIENKKILGSSIYRCREILLYQGALLVEADLSKIGVYIKHPKREPDYRNGRKHHDFVANINQFNPSWRTRQMIKDLHEAFQIFLTG